MASFHAGPEWQGRLLPDRAYDITLYAQPSSDQKLLHGVVRVQLDRAKMATLKNPPAKEDGTPRDEWWEIFDATLVPIR